MIAIDTNVLLRYPIQDHTRRSPIANRTIQHADKVLIVDIVLAEKFLSSDEAVKAAYL